MPTLLQVEGQPSTDVLCQVFTENCGDRARLLHRQCGDFLGLAEKST